MQLNYLGTIRLIMGLLPQHARAPLAATSSTSRSIGVQTNPPRFSAYVASKSALDAWTRVVSSECIADDVHFTTIHMPLVKTPMIAPTKLYDRFPTISPEQAAEMIAEAIRTRPKTVGTHSRHAGRGQLRAVPEAGRPGALDRLQGVPGFSRRPGQKDPTERASTEQALVRSTDARRSLVAQPPAADPRAYRRDRSRAARRTARHGFEDHSPPGQQASALHVDAEASGQLHGVEALHDTEQIVDRRGVDDRTGEQAQSTLRRPPPRSPAATLAGPPALKVSAPLARAPAPSRSAESTAASERSLARSDRQRLPPLDVVGRPADHQLATSLRLRRSRRTSRLGRPAPQAAPMNASRASSAPVQHLDLSPPQPSRIHRYRAHRSVAGMAHAGGGDATDLCRPPSRVRSRAARARSLRPPASLHDRDRPRRVRASVRSA